MDIFKGGDLKLLPLQDMVKNYGKAGNYFYNVVRGIDERPVVSHRERKSIGAERTFETDLTDLAEVKEKLDAIIDIMWKRCEAKEKKGKTVTLKLRFADFSTITRSNTSNKGFKKSEGTMVVTNLLPAKDIQEQGIRLLGVTMSNFLDEKQAVEKQLRIDFNRQT